jgi:hypothetical protein
MPWRKTLHEEHPANNPHPNVINPTHYRQMPTTAACGAPLIDLFINRTENSDEVTCPMCALVRSNFEARLSKLGHSTESETK